MNSPVDAPRHLGALRVRFLTFASVPAANAACSPPKFPFTYLPTTTRRRLPSPLPTMGVNRATTACVTTRTRLPRAAPDVSRRGMTTTLPGQRLPSTYWRAVPSSALFFTAATRRGRGRWWWCRTRSPCGDASPTTRFRRGGLYHACEYSTQVWALLKHCRPSLCTAPAGAAARNNKLAPPAYARTKPAVDVYWLT